MVDTTKIYKMNVIALHDVRCEGMTIYGKEDATILYSGTDNDGHERGVGFIVHNNIYRNVKSLKPLTTAFAIYTLMEGCSM